MITYLKNPKFVLSTLWFQIQVKSALLNKTTGTFILRIEWVYLILYYFSLNTIMMHSSTGLISTWNYLTSYHIKRKILIYKKKLKCLNFWKKSFVMKIKAINNKLNVFSCAVYKLYLSGESSFWVCFFFCLKNEASTHSWNNYYYLCLILKLPYMLSLMSVLCNDAADVSPAYAIQINTQKEHTLVSKETTKIYINHLKTFVQQQWWLQY